MDCRVKPGNDASLWFDMNASRFCGPAMSCKRWNSAVMIARSLKRTAERDQGFVAERTANELHPDRQSRFRLSRWHHQARRWRNDHVDVSDGIKMRSKRRSAPTQRLEVFHRAIGKSVLQPIAHLRTIICRACAQPRRVRARGLDREDDQGRRA